LSTSQGLQVYQAICRFTAASGAVRQCEFFVYHPTDRSMLEAALECYASGAPVEPTTWIRASREDAALVGHLGVRETGMLASASDYHTFYKFRPSGRAAAAQKYLAATEAVLDCGLRPRLHLEDATRAPAEFLFPFVEAVLALASRYGPAQRPRFRVCDTLGVGLPYPGVAWPRSVPRLIGGLLDLGLQPEDLEFHPHNDLHLAVANSLAAVMAGCACVNGTVFGKGERSGNVPIEGVLVHLIGMGYFPSSSAPDFRSLNDLADLYARWGQGLAAKFPLYGRDAHRTRAGIHADGLAKFWPMYAPFDVPALLGRPLEVSLTKESGLAGLALLIRQHTGADLEKTDPFLVQLHAQLEAEFAAGRQGAVEWEELRDRVLAHLGAVRS
jgi:2-phosphinomethylmalic acid synthase